MARVKKADISDPAAPRDPHTAQEESGPLSEGSQAAGQTDAECLPLSCLSAHLSVAAGSQGSQGLGVQSADMQIV